MKDLHQTYRIAAPIEKVWQALVDPKLIERWSGTPATMSDQPDADFELWSGDIHGKNLTVEAPAKLVQEWYGGHWPEPSLVTFTLHQEDHHTVVQLDHTNIPDDELKDIEDGWHSYYLGPLQKLVEKLEV